MKKVIAIIFCLFISITINAQEHLEFTGIPIDGNVYDFKSKLEEKSLKISDSEPQNHNITMRGKMTNNFIILKIYYSPITYVVYKIVMNFRYSYDVYDNQFTKILEDKYKSYLQDKNNKKYRWGCYKVDDKGNKIGRIFFHTKGYHEAEVEYTNLINQKRVYREFTVIREFTAINNNL